MNGGEIFVPKIPSIRIVDLAEAVAPGVPTKVIGIRPGEKMHEVMVTSDDAVKTVEFPDHYVIKPSLELWISYETDALGEAGNPVKDKFSYESQSNPHFLTVEEIRTLHGIGSGIA